MDELSLKLNSSFAGKVVRKDLTQKLKQGANVPTYVLEYLLGMYCATDDEDGINEGVQRVKNILADNFITDKDKKNFVIYKGQKLEADIAYIEIYQQAKKSIYVVDDYMNAKSLQHLSQKADGVEVVLFTENGKGGKGFLTKSLVTDFQNEYPSLQIKPNSDCHDRLIVLDYGEETELVYHCGASSKDAGKKLCAINQITETAIIHPVIDRLLLLPDKQI